KVFCVVVEPVILLALLSTFELGIVRRLDVEVGAPTMPGYAWGGEPGTKDLLFRAFALLTRTAAPALEVHGPLRSLLMARSVVRDDLWFHLLLVHHGAQAIELPLHFRQCFELDSCHRDVAERPIFLALHSLLQRAL